MSIKGLLFHFSIAYIVSTIAIGLTLNYFNLPPNAFVGFAVVALAIFSACYSFAKKNKRYLTPKEKNSVVIGAVLIGLLLQGIFAYYVMPKIVLPNAILAVVLLVAILLQIAATYWALNLTEKSLSKWLTHHSSGTPSGAP